MLKKKKEKPSKTKQLCFHQCGTKWIHCCCFSWCCFLLFATDASEAYQICISSTGGSVAPLRFHSRSPAAAGATASACGGREIGGESHAVTSPRTAVLEKKCFKWGKGTKMNKKELKFWKKQKKNQTVKSELLSCVSVTHWIGLLNWSNQFMDVRGDFGSTTRLFQ